MIEEEKRQKKQDKRRRGEEEKRRKEQKKKAEKFERREKGFGPKTYAEAGSQSGVSGELLDDGAGLADGPEVGEGEGSGLAGGLVVDFHDDVVDVEGLLAVGSGGVDLLDGAVDVGRAENLVGVDDLVLVDGAWKEKREGVRLCQVCQVKGGGRREEEKGGKEEEREKGGRRRREGKDREQDEQEREERRGGGGRMGEGDEEGRKEEERKREEERRREGRKKNKKTKRKNERGKKKQS